VLDGHDPQKEYTKKKNKMWKKKAGELEKRLREKGW
jgi:hypothetical protein